MTATVDRRPPPGAAAVRHRRQRRRRQVDADRPAAARLQVDLRGPARAHRGRQQAPRQRLRRPRPPHRRPAGRARAGHHDRRRLPLLLDAGARLRHRRLPRPRPVHPQRHHRRLDGRPGDRARRRPPRHRRADPPPQPARVAARRAPPRDLRQQDGPRRLRPGPLRGHPPGVHRVRRPARPARRHVHPDLGARRRQRRRPLGVDVVVRGADAAPPPGDGVHGERRQPDRRPLPGPVRHPPAAGRVPRLPRLRRHRRRRHAAPRRRGDGAAVRADVAHRAHRHRRRTGRGGHAGHGRHRAAGRRPRHLPRRHDLPPAQPARRRRRTSTPWWRGWTPTPRWPCAGSTR